MAVPQGPEAPSVVILGGGITGLAAAYRLQRRMRETGRPLRITLLERDDELGGKLQTIRHDGFLIERGPDIFMARKPRGLGLCRELGIMDRLCGTNPVQRGSYIQRGGRLYRLPEGLSGLVPAKLGPLARSPLLTPGAKLRAALDLLLPARRSDADESVGAFISRRLGRGVFESVVEPLLGGIYGGDGDAISLAATFPQLRELERTYGSLIRGLRASKAEAAGVAADAPETAFVSFTDGMGTFPQAIAEQLDAVTVRTGVGAFAVESAGGDAEGDGAPHGRYRIPCDDSDALEADAVLVTTPAYVAADLLRADHEALADALDAIPYGSTSVVWLAYDADAVPHPLDAYGYIIPRSEGTRVAACTWASTKIPNRAPEGKVLIRVFIGRVGDEAIVEAPEADLVRLAQNELQQTLGITAPPLFHVLQRWLRSMPQYVMGHLDRVARIEALAAERPGLALAGTAYHGVGIPDSIQDGERAADRLFDYLHALPSRQPSASR